MRLRRDTVAGDPRDCGPYAPRVVSSLHTKLHKVENAAKRLLAHARAHRHVPARTLRSFAGLCNSTGLAVVDARLRLRELFDALALAVGTPPVAAPQAKHFRRAKCRAHSARQPRISHAGMRDLRWWTNLSRNPHVRREVWPAPTATMFTDASMRGLGAVWNGKVPVSGLFDERNEGSSINELELLAAIYGLRAFAQFARAPEATQVSDSLVTVHIVRNWTSRAPPLLSHLRTLRALCESMDVTISTRHLPSALNLWAGRLFCRRDSI
jgi:hypothetical protein